MAEQNAQQRRQHAFSLISAFAQIPFAHLLGGGEEGRARSRELFDLTSVYGERATRYPNEGQTVGLAAYEAHKLDAGAGMRVLDGEEGILLPPWLLAAEDAELPFALDEEARRRYTEHANSLIANLVAPLLDACTTAGMSMAPLYLQSAGQEPGQPLHFPISDLPDDLVQEVDEQLMGRGMTPEEAAAARTLFIGTPYRDLCLALATS